MSALSQHTHFIMHQSRQAIFACSSTALRLECCCSLSRISLIFFGWYNTHTHAFLSKSNAALFEQQEERKKLLLSNVVVLLYFVCAVTDCGSKKKKSLFDRKHSSFSSLLFFYRSIFERVCVCVFRSFYFDSVYAFSCCTGF